MNYQAQTTQFGSKTRVIKLAYLGQEGQLCYDFSTRLGTSDSRTLELPSVHSMGGMRRYGWEKLLIDVKPVMIELTGARQIRLEAESAHKRWLAEYRTAALSDQAAERVKVPYYTAPKVPGRRTKAAVIYTTVLRGRCECCGKNRGVEWFGGANLPEPPPPLVGGYWDQEDVPC